MAKRGFRPDDAYRLRTASDPDLSPDGRRVAFAVTDTGPGGTGCARRSGCVPPTAPRRRAGSPRDRRTRARAGRRTGAGSPTSRLADDQPDHAHVRLAPLDGGMPARLGDLPGPVSRLAWSPDSTRIVVVCRVGVPDRAKAAPGAQRAARPARARGAPRRRRLAGRPPPSVRRRCGRRIGRQLTRGDYDHDDPSFSPDGATIAFASDRHPRRDDRQFRGDSWVLPAPAAGRPRRLTDGKGRAAFPTFSPDGKLDRVRRPGHRRWDDDTHVFVVPADGGAAPEAVAPELDRPPVLFPGLPAPVCWIGDRELLMLVADHGSVTLHRARVGERRSREVVGGDISIDGFAARPAGARSRSPVRGPTGRASCTRHHRGRRAGAADRASTTTSSPRSSSRRSTGRRSSAPTAPRSSTSRSCRRAGGATGCRCTSTSTAARTHRGPPAAGSPCTRRSPRPATSWSCPTRVAARATARRSRARAPATGGSRRRRHPRLLR